MKKIPFIVKIALKPLLVLTLLIAVSLIGFSKGFYQIGSLREGLSKAKKSENILKSKLDMLSIGLESVEQDANSAVTFLPGENPALLVLSQLRGNAAVGGLILSNYKVGSEAKDASGFMKIPISFDVEGPLESVLNFANFIKKVSPNTWIDKTEMDFVGENLRASISTNSYFLPFPTKMPASTEPITALDTNEKEIISNLSSYTQPSFVNMTAGFPRENLNPFGE